MKKILFVSHSISRGGGVGKVFSTLATQIADKYEISILERGENNKTFPLPSSIKHLPPMFYYPERAKELGFKTSFFSVRRVVQSLMLLIIPSFFHKKYIKEKYDIEIAFNYLYPSVIVGSSSNKESKKVMWIHGDIYDLVYQSYAYPKRILKYFHYMAQKKAFACADRIVAISNNTYKSIIDLFPNTKNKVVLISNGFDFSEMIKLSRKFDVNTDDKIRFICIGRLDSGKNVQLQVNAFVNLFDSGIHNVELYVLGEGAEKDNIELIAGKYLNYGIHLLGFKRNPYPYIRSSDCLLITSKSEGFPTVAIEAMALGKPVMSTKVGGIDEIVVEGLNGMTIDYTVEDVIEKITFFIQNRSNFNPETISESVSKYTAEKWGDNFVSLINEIYA